ncbi:helix-turn-helix domain-containing protein [Stutzerimonas stutzeri]|uniref:helix-turn-helix domain-containing protein n=1 Tax=Stutzerimonas stutzeri TaxID=316 RepID=UPI000397786E|nr:helix-turn-helix domain-containing protein [Stutzerimonas stutzeri]EQM76416.1 hypothetical protein L686_17230 [Stutzerimonas stutzeri MF28]
MRKNEERTLEAELQLCPEQNHIGEHQREDHIVPDIPSPVNHSTEAQALRLVQALRAGPITTIRAAQELDIVHPPSTVRYLRRKGWGILTEWAYEPTERGRRPHRVGLYVLVKEAA